MPVPKNYDGEARAKAIGLSAAFKAIREEELRAVAEKSETKEKAKK